MLRRTTLIFMFLLSSPSLATAQKFFEDDPVWKDEDQILAPRPEPRDLSQIADLLLSTFVRRPEGSIPLAENVNTLGEVPDSSWFTNRIGLHPISLEELVRGPNQWEGPDLSTPWEIIAVKSEGITPGLRIRDGRGDVYLIKFDPPDYPQLATSAEAISTKFFHAFGYHVPENYLAFIRPSDLRISPKATIEEFDRERPLKRTDLEYLLERVAHLRAGTIPVLASRFLSGKPLGPFEYFATRSDDANDIFSHENRRELRGLRVFSAWLNHDDVRSINTLDTFISSGDKGYVRHHLIDFGSCLGSGSVKPQNPRAGHEYIVESAPIVKGAISLGIWDRPWRKVKYPGYLSIGNFEADFFEPHKWKPEYPNPAFERMRPEDAFWAAKIVERFSDETIRALVRTGKLEDPGAENYLVRTLLKRRDKIVRFYFSQLNPLDRFEISPNQDSLAFENLGLQAGLSGAASYEHQWFSLDNDAASLKAITKIQSADRPALSIPGSDASILMVRIRTVSADQPNWRKKVDVYLRNAPQKSVAGIEREE